eukprot:956886-Ditylum_brightwellii.AAC.1
MVDCSISYETCLSSELPVTSSDSKRAVSPLQLATTSAPSSGLVGSFPQSPLSCSQSVGPQTGSAMMIMPRRPIPEFLFQLTQMLSDSCNQSLIEWSAAKRRIVVHNPINLEKEVLQKYFRHSKYSSFQRQLNYFGFRKNAGKGRMSPCSYENDAATDDLRSLLFIKRRTQGNSSMTNKKDKKAKKKSNSVHKDKSAFCQQRVEEQSNCTADSTECGAKYGTHVPDVISSTVNSNECLAQDISHSNVSSVSCDAPPTTGLKTSENLLLPTDNDTKTPTLKDMQSLFAHHQCNVPNPLLQSNPLPTPAVSYVSPLHSPSLCTSNENVLSSSPATEAVNGVLTNSQNNAIFASDDQADFSLGFPMVPSSLPQIEGLNSAAAVEYLTKRLPSSGTLFSDESMSVVSLDDSDYSDSREREMAYLLSPSPSLVDLAVPANINRI